ncbi:acyl-CoA dehydrogenase family protein [Xanthobacter agilis]|uniref:acyl-CoA dehydrogenase family protein n=1 Tax=Xanthobacter agilis TaxID=47492 RepID=UPI00372A9F4F
MKFAFSPELEAFRQDVRRFVADTLSPATRAKVDEGRRLVKSDYVDWYRILHAKGWITPGWPVEHGGTDWSPLERYIFEEETALGGAPPVTGGINMIGPVLIAFGTPEQKAAYLPAMRRGDLWWAQGFSEPGAGSDLASLATRAVLDGDHYVVNGTKIWQTQAAYADMMFALVRTRFEGKPQEGITLLLLDMNSPGLSIQPIRTIDGGQELYQCFFDNVRVPVENRVGADGKGWTYAKYLLGFERHGIAGIGHAKRQMARIKRVAAAEHDRGTRLIDLPRWRDRIALLEIELMALECLSLRLIQESEAKGAGAGPGVEASILKIRGTELRQDMFELLTELTGPYGIPFDEEVMRNGWGNEAPVGPAHAATIASNYLDSRKISIYGGANEIQRNVLAKAILGV